MEAFFVYPIAIEANISFTPNSLKTESQVPNPHPTSITLSGLKSLITYQTYIFADRTEPFS